MERLVLPFSNIMCTGRRHSTFFTLHVITSQMVRSINLHDLQAFNVAAGTVLLRDMQKFKYKTPESCSKYIRIICAPLTAHFYST